MSDELAKLYAQLQYNPKQLQKIIKAEKELKSKFKRRSRQAIASATDFLAFRKYVCGHDTRDHQLEWCNILNTGKSNRYLKGIAGDDACILAPRNSAKSTVLLQWVAWVIGTHVDAGISLKILYISYVIDVAASKSRQVKNIISSERYNEVFPKVRKNIAKWGENEWAIDFEFAGLRTIDEDYTVACSGMAGAINSRRAMLGIFDDILKDRSTAQNKAIQDKMIENYYSVIQFTRYEGARFINLGTRMAKHDVYAKIFIPPLWQVHKQSALITEVDGSERSFCEPTSQSDGVGMGISLDTLRQEREMDLESFMLQRQNEIPATTAQGINIKHIKYGWLPTKFDRLVIGIDLAVSEKESGDYTAMVLVGISKNNLYVCDGALAKIKGNMRKIDMLYDLWLKRKDTCVNPCIVAVDANKFHAAFEGDLKDYLDNISGEDDVDPDFKKLIISLVASTHRGKEKIDRIDAHSLLFEKGRIIFNRVCDTQFEGVSVLSKLVSEITDWNPLDHNDLMDGLELGVFEARNYLHGELSVK